MGKTTVFMSMSLDGFIAGANPAPDNPLGDHGLKLHDWFFDNPERTRLLTKHAKEVNGALIIGRVMYDESQPYWDGMGPLGNDVPCFVLTKPGTEPQKAGQIFTFVTEGIEKAFELAKKVAGDKDVSISGGANTIQQYIKAGMVDELTIAIVPILLGGGTSLFGSLGEYIELEKVEVQDDVDVTRLTYRIKR
jgi:dihydrofolate reductase